MSGAAPYPCRIRRARAGRTARAGLALPGRPTARPSSSSGTS